MQYTVYILYSPSHQKIYIGYTSNLLNRFNSHNNFGTKDWTRSFRPWTVIYCEYYTDKAQSMKREKQLKTSSARALINAKINTELRERGYITNLIAG